MKSSIILVILLLTNILSPLATLFIDYKTTDEPRPVWFSFAVLGIVISVINNKLKPRWLKGIYPFLFFLVVCMTVHLVNAKIQSDLSDLRLETIGASHSPGHGYPILIFFLAIPCVFLSATTYLFTQGVIAACKRGA
jgi:hypothetical protein